MDWYPTKSVSIPMSLYESERGKYFVGYADNLTFSKTTDAWASLENPIDSGVLLYVNVWTVTDVGENPIRMQIWFNSKMPEDGFESDLVTPSNTAISPLPVPKIKLTQASDVSGTPEGGVKAFVRRAQSQETVVAEEDGKFIFKPGGSFSIFLSNPEGPDVPASGRVAFGWWEEKIKC